MKRYLVCSFLALCFWACDSSGSKKSGQVDSAFPVEEKGLISLGGTQQYVEITSVSDKNPVLLFMGFYGIWQRQVGSYGRGSYVFSPGLRTSTI